MSATGTIECRPLPDGYWAATIEIPSTADMPPYRQTERLFHDEQEARDWAEWMLSWLTDAYAAVTAEPPGDDATTKEGR